MQKIIRGIIVRMKALFTFYANDVYTSLCLISVRLSPHLHALKGFEKDI